MDKNHEVEFRALITKEIFDTLLLKGRTKCSDTLKGSLTLVDAYFCANSIKTFKEIEMDHVGSYSLRLRSESVDGETSCSMNTKVIQAEGDHNAWLEHETGISSFSESGKILNDIGFKKFFELRKNRFSFQDGPIHVCLEDIADYQPAIELEIMTTKDGTEAAKRELLAYFAGNGISEQMIVKKSITNLLMREKARF